MLYLPTVGGQPAGLQIPLADETAAVLLHALLEPAAHDRPSILEPVLRTDPLLAYWVSLRAVEEGRELRDTTTAASWLASVTAQRLCGLYFDPAPARSDALVPLQQWVELAAQARDRAAETSAVLAERTYWATVLYAAHRWLVQTTSVDAKRRISAVCPKWLDALCALIGRPSSASDEAPESAELATIAHCISFALGRSSGSARSTVSGRHEVGLLHLLPALVARIARSEQLEADFEAAKLRSLKELAYGAGHEINNPLANISARAQTLLKDETDPERRRKLAAINTQAFRAHEMIADMMLFAKPPQLQISRTDMVELVQSVLERYQIEAAERAITISFVADHLPLIILGDPTQLRMAIRALVTNAIEAIGQGGTVELQLSKMDSEVPAARSQVQLTIADTGPGIPAEIQPYIFDPFYSGREAGRGLGFGLSKCWQIATRHGGSIKFTSTPGRGTIFMLRLPSDGPAAPDEPPSSPCADVVRARP